MPVIPNNNRNVDQLIDANLDRAREGLRVIEDWCRFVLKNKQFVIKTKDWRQQLGKKHHEIYKEARHSISDEANGLTHPSQKNRKDPLQIVIANFARVQEALRVLEEFSRLTDTELSEISSVIRYQLYDFELDVLKASKNNQRLKTLESCKLCLITMPHPQLTSTVLLALKAGVKMVQFRCKEGNDIENLKKAEKLASLCKRHDSLFIVNDRLDLAIASNADGIHLGKNDLPIETARKIIGKKKIIGLTANSLQEIHTNQSKDCDYLGIGPICKTKSKPEKSVLGIDFIKKVTSHVKIPWFAIGGINQSNVSKIKNAGANQIAVINAIMNSNDPYSSTKELLEKLK